MIAYDKLGGMRKEAVMVYFKVILHYLPRWTV